MANSKKKLTKCSILYNFHKNCIQAKKYAAIHRLPTLRLEHLRKLGLFQSISRLSSVPKKVNLFVVNHT